NSEPVTNVLTGWKADRVELDETGAITLTVDGKYDYAEGTCRYTFGVDGEIDVAWNVTWTAEENVDLFQTGVLLEMPDGFDTVHWQRDRSRLRWTAYPEDHVGRPVGTARRMGDPATLAERQAWKKDDRSDWSWSQDLINVDTDQVSTQDFRATKFNVLAAHLVNEQGAGLAVESDGTQNAQVFPTDTGYAFQVGSFHNGGTEHHLVKSVRRDIATAAPGEVFGGRVKFRLVPAGESE
ncbi:MAG: hypothetical protein AAGK78_05935, partial [Planctomycetota bacterium]